MDECLPTVKASGSLEPRSFHVLFAESLLSSKTSNVEIACQRLIERITLFLQTSHLSQVKNKPYSSYLREYTHVYQLGRGIVLRCRE